ncbi:helix-turn-helix transcriptional regulator [Microbulbifer sp. ZKSA006]|uniref:helix-turn-helix transcriptional regulator n=1 Tax=Microbulbifer sp. ZKSA006 TaxID=3243390 RepID=UPI00403A508B
MIASYQKGFDSPPRQKASFTGQDSAELFQFQKIRVQPGEVTPCELLSEFNLFMVVDGVAAINCGTCEFHIASGQVWLAGAVDGLEVSNLFSGRELLIICASIGSAMLTRFYERHSQVLIRAKNTQAALPRVEASHNSAPFIFPECDLTRLTLDSLDAFSELNDDSLNSLKLEELLLLKLKGGCGCRLAEELLRQINPANERFRRFMEANVTQHWSVADYAKQIGMSLTSFKNRFSRVFKAESPKAWINERRLQHADIQLRTTHKRLVDIALDSGFSSQSYFTQRYKSMYGYPPSEVRQKPLGAV